MPDGDQLDRKWQKYWWENQIYAFDPEDVSREHIYSIDTPPPGVSGTLHMGHVFGYSQMDMVARYQRLRGKNVFYPIGYDDNGLPSERYVEKKINRRGCDMSRQEFTKICHTTILMAEKQIFDLFQQASYSFNPQEEYRTISSSCARISQMSFLDLHQQNLLYRRTDPVLWDMANHTALAQSELEDKILDSARHYLTFHTPGGDAVIIMTTRPELLPACGAVLCHPQDNRHRGTLLTPLGVPVPIIPSEDVDYTKGTGMVMCCTFGDQMDVEWWKRYQLPLRPLLQPNGRFDMSSVAGLVPTKYMALNGDSVEEARQRILKLLQADGLIAQESVPIRHNVKVSSISQCPVEFLLQKQWFIRLLELCPQLHQQVDRINWKPISMKVRLHDWISNLSQDWCISRQRFFGIPIPVWYTPEEEIIPATVSQLPVDPTVDLPEEFTGTVRGETDVLDTWATSALTPQLNARGISSHLREDPRRYSTLSLPFDLRCQGHDILRTWAFYTILKSFHHTRSLPWKNVLVNGWCLATDGSKMSKSKGNVIDPVKIFHQFGSDAVRYWAAKSTPGLDTTYQEETVVAGQRLCTKLVNCGQFLEIHRSHRAEPIPPIATDIVTGRLRETLDLWLLQQLDQLLLQYQEFFDDYEYAKALDVLERFFRDVYCDNYLEIVKIRCYGDQSPRYRLRQLDNQDRINIRQSQQSALHTLYHSYHQLLRLFAPFLPVITEELYYRHFPEEFQQHRSLHLRGNGAQLSGLQPDIQLEALGKTTLEVVAQVRRHKSGQNVSLKTPLSTLTIRSPLDLSSLREDLENVCGVNQLLLESAPSLQLLLGSISTAVTP
jgi:valyl-tRNA synthetase